jgi:hypothetical protein
MFQDFQFFLFCSEPKIVSSVSSGAQGFQFSECDWTKDQELWKWQFLCTAYKMTNKWPPVKAHTHFMSKLQINIVHEVLLKILFKFSLAKKYVQLFIHKHIIFVFIALQLRAARSTVKFQWVYLCQITGQINQLNMKFFSQISARAVKRNHPITYIEAFENYHN